MAPLIHAVFLATVLTAQATGDTRTALLDTLVTAYADLEQFSGAVLVAERGRVVYRAGFGFADRELSVPISPNHRFVTGSMSKAFTAVLVLQQVERGVLALDSPTVRYWPEFSDSSRGQMTIRHLLTHRSGLPHWGAIDGFLLQEARLTHDHEALVALFTSTGLRFTPGEDEAYSSIGYYVLGIVLEKVTNKTYGELLQEMIFDPLGMTSSALDDQATILPSRVASYRYNFVSARYDNAEYRDPSTTYSTGGIISTVDDLLKWDVALYGNVLIEDSLRSLLFDPTEGTRAFGWNKGLRAADDGIVWHVGLVTGYRSQITRDPTSNQTVILLSNLRDTDTFEITSRILEVLNGSEPALPKRSLMKEILAVAAGEGVTSAIARFDDIVRDETQHYRTESTQLLLAAIELRSDDRCDRAAPLYEHWLRTYESSRFTQRAIRDAADCRLLLTDTELAGAHIERLAVLNPEHPSLPDLRSRLAKQH